MKPLFIRGLRFFCAGAIFTTAMVELLYPASTNAAALASPVGGLAALLVAKKLAILL